MSADSNADDIAKARSIGRHEFVLVLAVLVIITVITMGFALRPSEESKDLLLPVVTGLLGFLASPKRW